MMKRIFVITILLAMALSLCACGKKEVPELRVEDIRRVGKLATLECKYNNVAKKTKKADNIFEKERVMWIEYEGTVLLGIEMNEVEIDISGTTIKIKMPEAKVIDKSYTMTDKSVVMNKDGIFKNKITAEEQEEAVKEAQAEMEKTANADKALLLQAQTRAEELIENYITSLSKAIGTEYTIEWISE